MRIKLVFRGFRFLEASVKAKEQRKNMQQLVWRYPQGIPAVKGGENMNIEEMKRIY